MPQKKERTEAQKLAARLNGAKSRGPVTPEGKATSSLNATRHGLAARRVVLDNELTEVWDDFVQALIEEWNPQTASELQIIHDLAAARWRLNRLLDIETESMNVEMWREEKPVEECVPHFTTLTRITLAWQTLNSDGTLPALHRHEARLRRIIRDSQNQLIALAGLRSAAAPATPPAVTHEPGKAPVQNEPEGAPAATEDKSAPSDANSARLVRNEPGSTGPTAQPRIVIPDPKRPLSQPPGLKAA